MHPEAVERLAHELIFAEGGLTIEAAQRQAPRTGKPAEEPVDPGPGGIMRHRLHEALRHSLTHHRLAGLAHEGIRCTRPRAGNECREEVAAVRRK